MKLAICTDVFAGLSYTDMLDKVKSLGIDAVEMTAGGWGARKHCNTAELLADEGKRRAFMDELDKRGMRISALNTSCNPLWPSATGEAYKKSMYDCATLAGLLGVKKIVAMAGLPAGKSCRRRSPPWRPGGWTRPIRPWTREARDELLLHYRELQQRVCRGGPGSDPYVSGKPWGGLLFQRDGSKGGAVRDHHRR